jgi:hypothetical protein
MILKTKKQSRKEKVEKPPAEDLKIHNQTLIKKIKQLEKEKEALRDELWKHKKKPSGKIGYALLFFGLIALILSFIYASFISAFIGIALTFWGALLLFIKPITYARASLINSTAIPSILTINHILSELKYKGKAIYLPPRYLKEFKSGKIFISSKKGIILPPTEEIAEEKIFLKNPNGICLPPPGLHLTNLYEEELGTDFAGTDINYLQNNLPKLLIEDLEIAENFEINLKNNKVHIILTGSIFKSFCTKLKKFPNICNSIGCPLCSSIALALTRVTGKPVIIEKTKQSDNGKTIEAYYRILKYPK